MELFSSSVGAEYAALRGLKFLGDGIYKYFALDGAERSEQFARFSTPTELNHSAQRCEERATLGLLPPRWLL